MPLTVRIRNPMAPTASYLSNSQPIYDNTYIPCHDFKKEHQDDIRADHANENQVEEYAREVPYYAEEEAFPEATAVSEEAECAIDMPDMVSELADYEPTPAFTRWIPPPPPTMTIARSLGPMRFWYSRLLAHPLYLPSSRLAGQSCPAPEVCASDEEWTRACSEWWDTLSAEMCRRDMTEMSPARSWNPYDLQNNVRYHLPRDRAAPLVPEAARFPLPPPPAHESFSDDYAARVGWAVSERLYVQSLVRWWRMAAQWTAAAAVSRQWLCPPPTTAETPRAWGAAIGQWWAVTLAEMRMEDEKNARLMERNARSGGGCTAPVPTANTAVPSLCYNNNNSGHSVSTPLLAARSTAIRSLNGLQLW